MKAPSPAFRANDLDASAAIDAERATALRVEAEVLERFAADKRKEAAALREPKA